MTVGRDARLARLRTKDRYLVVPMDHGITLGAVRGLADVESTVAAVTRGGADAVLSQKGLAPRVHPNKNGAGYVVHLNGSTAIGPDERDKRPTGTVEAAVRAGADAVSFHINVGSVHEPDQLSQLATVTDDAVRFGMPVLAMAYARGPDVASDDPEALGHAVRLAEEVGADLVKTGYTGDSETFERVVEATRLPVLIAGGARSTDRETLETVRGAIDAGAAGVSMGRSIFQHDDPKAMTQAVSRVVHDDLDVGSALDEAGLTIEL